MAVRIFSTFILPFVTAGIFLLLLSALSSGETLDRVIAIVNGDIITLTDYQRYMISIGKKGNLSAIDEYQLKKMIEEKVLLHEAVKRGGSVSDIEIDGMLEETRKAGALSDEELRNELAREGLSFEEYRRVLKEKLLVTKLIRTDIDTKIAVTEKEVGEYYQAHMGRFLKNPSKVEIKAIFMRLKQDATLTELTDLKRKALKIMASIRDGYDFDAVRDRYSEEPWGRRESKLAEFSRGELIAELDNLVFAMKKDEVRGPLWLKDGLYIVKLVKRTEEVMRSQQEVRNEIEKMIYEQKKDRLYNEWMKSLWEASSVNIIE